ncbi:class I SAM-dependent methyltransferase [Antribacter gilvus]|uniref:class I SAM-dependent methyltransferase n=1 Tax=Antribacter gilvus TaxID=2304675 RepID=UPI000F7870A4|nr:class I SAM-dependent methyltransferase [Antribacter gilvus]
MPDHDPYGDPDLVTLYDLDNPAGPDHAFYRALADTLGARTILDLGCGTGLLTRALATEGRRVVGVDPSHTMLDHARAQPGADKVTWILGDASALPDAAGPGHAAAPGNAAAPHNSADLVVCTGNAIMHIGPDDLPRALDAVARSLRPGGVLAFETRNPAYREWERWTRDATYGERMTSLGLLREWIEVASATDSRVVFDAHNELPSGEDRVYTTVLHFRDEITLRAALAAAGFAETHVAGGWHDDPVTDDSRVLVFTAALSSRRL